MATVLIIEDEAPIRANLERLLKAEGYQVVAGTDGASGVAAARAHRPDVIICDILMPGMDGYGVLAALRADADADTARIPFIFLTASADRDERERGIESGASDFVTKPFRLAELLGVVRRHLGEKA